MTKILNKNFLFRTAILLAVALSAAFFYPISAEAAIITSTATGGVWNVGSTWVGGVAPANTDSVIIATTGGNSVTMGAARINAGLTVNSGAILNFDGAFALTENGNVVVNGSVTGATGTITANTVGITMDGSGTIGSIIAVSQNFSFLSTANLTINNNITSQGRTVTNNGTINLNGNFARTGGTAIWTQGTNATLNISGAFTPAANVTVTATAAGNTINYDGAAQSLKATTYVNLTLSGSNVKTFPTGITTINGIHSIEGTATTALTGTITYGGASTLQYKGSAAQTTGGEFPATWIGTGGIKIENASGVTLGAAKNIGAQSLTIGAAVSNSVFNDGGFQLTSTGALNLTSGTFKLGSAGTATVWPSFGTNNISSGTTVEYASGAAQTVSATPSYKNLTFSGAGAKTTAAGTVTVGGNWSTTGGTATLSTNNSNITVTGNITGTGAITSGSGTITLAGDWANSGTFTKGTGTVTYNGGSAQTVGALTYNNLIINKAGGSASLGGSGARVDGALTLTSGNITTSSNDIYISSTGSVSRTSGHIVGNLKKNIATGATSKTFEIGDASNYTPVSLIFGNVTVAGDLTAKTTAGDHPQIGSSTINPSKSINRYWTLTNSGISFNNYSVVLNFINPGDIDSGANTANFIVGLYNAGWTYPTVGTKNSTNTQATGVTGFGDFQLGEILVIPDTTAPAAVSNLAASNATNNSIDLSWTAPGDDNNTGTATTYDVRYSTSVITSGNFAGANQATGEPSPSIAGSSESMTVSGLSASTLYYFAIKTSDEVPNTSAISNIPSAATTAIPDTTAPAAVSNLATTNPTNSSIDLTWTAPGDDNNTGTAASYDLRYSTSLITAGNFSSATAVTGEPSPSVAGSAESMTVTGLSPSTLYYFALKTSDEVPNISAISNVPTGTTSANPDTIAPAAVTDLAVSNPTNNSIDLSWTAPGDDNNSGIATTYDLRYSTSLITDGNFSSATAVAGEPAPSIAGSAESMTVSGLLSSTAYYFALKTSDEVPNTSAISNIPSAATTAIPDTTAPAAVSDLAASLPSVNSITVSWTAPGDDNNTGTAASYDLRYSTSLITAGNFSSATAITGEPAPSIAGSAESMVVSGLSANTLYYLALKTSDEVPNISAISNIPSLSTLVTADTTAPAITAFSIPSTSDSLTIAITSFTANDNVGVAGYLLTESASVPLASDPGWIMTAPVNYVFSAEGNKILYAWAKDSSGNISTSLSGSIAITLPVSAPQPAIGQATSGGVLPTSVIFSGRAYPNGKIRVYRRSAIESSFKNDYLPNFDIDIDNNGDFNKTFTGLLQSNYLFALEGIDKTGQSGGIISFTANLISGNSLIVNEIFLSPTIVIQNKSITKGNEIKVAGYAYPNSNIELKIDNVLRVNSKANNVGYYESIINTSRFSPKVHFVSVRQIAGDGKASEFSTAKNFTVSALKYPQADLNGDNAIDIKDWSIFLFRWKANSALKAFDDLNFDGKVDIADLSVFLKAMKGL